MQDLAGRVGAITGAGSGIGRALALELARRGCHVALSDVNPDGLAETAARVDGIGSVRVTTHVVDVAALDSMTTWAHDVVAVHGAVNLIVNNAGVALVADVADMRRDDLEWVMDIDFWGVVNGTTAFLPHLRAAGEGHVVNISSVFGLMGIPSQSAYNAAKFGVRGYTEALRIELDIERCGVSATSVHPGGIKTDIVRNGRLPDDPRTGPIDREEAVRRFDRQARTSPERAAELILRAVTRNRRRALIGVDAHLFDLAVRLAPGLSQRVVGELAKRDPGIVV